MPLRVDLFLSRIVSAAYGFNDGWDGLDRSAKRSIWDNFGMLLSIVPWVRVVHLGIQGLGLLPTEYANLLRRCINLEELVCLDSPYCHNPRNVQVAAGSVRMPNLKNLLINVGMRDNNEDVLRMLAAPNLCHLTLETARRVMPQHQLTTLFRFLDNSSCRVETFVFLYAWLPSSSEVRETLKALPHLKNLDIHHSDEPEARYYPASFNAELFEQLALNRGSEYLVPKLERLVLGSLCTHPMDQHDCDAAVDFLEARANAEQPLKYVKMELESKRRAETIDRINALSAKTGLIADIQVWG